MKHEKAIETAVSDWDSLLKEFHSVEQSRPKDFKAKLEQLKIKASNSSQLTGRQREGIIDRCNNVINNSYGNTKQGIEFKGS